MQLLLLRLVLDPQLLALLLYHALLHLDHIRLLLFQLLLDGLLELLDLFVLLQGIHLRLFYLMKLFVTVHEHQTQVIGPDQRTEVDVI